jgi:hypothetical protein
MMMSGHVKGTYWGIDSSTQHYRADLASPQTDVIPGYSPALARDVIAAMRIDYDECSDAEAAVLENHGYLLAAAAIRTHLPHHGKKDPPLRVPHPAWMAEPRVREALRNSGEKVFLGRGRLDTLLGRETPGSMKVDDID